MHNKLTIQSEIIIESPVALAWQALTEMKAYGRWNPMTPKATGKFCTGEWAKVYFKSTVGLLVPFKVAILCADGNRLYWEGSMFGVRGVHFFDFIQLANGKTKFEHREVFEGLLVRVFAWFIRLQTVKTFRKFDRALKKEAEDLYTQHLSPKGHA